MSRFVEDSLTLKQWIEFEQKIITVSRTDVILWELNTSKENLLDYKDIKSFIVYFSCAILDIFDNLQVPQQ